MCPFAVAIALLPAGCGGVAPTAASAPPPPVEPGCPSVVEGAPPGLLIRVQKSVYKLGIYRDGALTSGPAGEDCFAVALGGAPVGDKLQRGDERTPEGEFRVTHRNPASAYHLSLGLNYPAARHAKGGFEAGFIDAPTRDRIVEADRPGRLPVRDSALGGDIYLHGGGPAPRDWTDGCVAMDTAAIDRLYALADPGTRVWIVP